MKPATIPAPAPPLTMPDRVFTVFAMGERFGLPVSSVQTVFRVEQMTPIPLAREGVLGLINLRGRIVTAVSLRSRLDMPAAPDTGEPLAIGIDHRGEAAALIVDEAGDVMDLTAQDRMEMPTHMTPARMRLTQAVYRVDGAMISILDLPALFDLTRSEA